MKIIFLAIITLLFGTIDYNLKNTKWRVRRIEAYGQQKFTREQIDSLKNSMLIITDTSWCYQEVKSIKRCYYKKIEIKEFIFDEYYDSYTFTRFLTTKEREFLKVVTFADDSAQGTCFNDCAHFYLKSDTLINVCGGWTLYLTRVE